MRRFHVAGLTVLCLLLFSSCGVARRRPPEAIEPTPENTNAHPSIPEMEPSIDLEMPFMAADVSRELEPFQHLHGLRNARITFFGAEKLFWNDFEASESSGYTWDEYDTVIREVESLGGDILPTIWSISTWATEVPSFANPSSAPKPAYRRNYADFVQAFMERYDHDGVDDMPGLLHAHSYLQIEDEAENLGDSWIASAACDAHQKNSDAYFRCAADEYGEMLKLGYQAARTANPDAKIVSFSFNFGDFFDANPANLPAATPFAQNRLAFLDQVFTGYSRYFDVIAVQCNYDYPGIPLAVDYMRDTYGLGKPAICADAASMPMIGQRQSQPGDRYKDKYPFLTDGGILGILDEAAANPKYAEIRLWWEAEKSKLSVKKVVVAADAGVRQIGFQFVMTGWGGRNTPWRHSELLSAGPEYGDAEPAGTPRPVVYALGQLGERIANFHSVENLNPIRPGTDPHSWLWMYRFTNGDRTLYVIWSGSGERMINLTEYISVPTARITHIVTTLDGNNRPVYPPDETFPAGLIPVDETPILVEQQAGQVSATP